MIFLLQGFTAQLVFLNMGSGFSYHSKMTMDLNSTIIWNDTETLSIYTHPDNLVLRLTGGRVTTGDRFGHDISLSDFKDILISHKNNHLKAVRLGDNIKIRSIFAEVEADVKHHFQADPTLKAECIEGMKSAFKCFVASCFDFFKNWFNEKFGNSASLSFFEYKQICNQKYVIVSLNELINSIFNFTFQHRANYKCYRFRHC